MEWIPIVSRACSVFVVLLLIFIYFVIAKQDRAAKRKLKNQQKNA